MTSCFFQNGLTPLHLAVQRRESGHASHVVKLLLARGAKVNSRAGVDAQTPLHHLVRYGDLSDADEVIFTLLRHGANLHMPDKVWWGFYIIPCPATVVHVYRHLRLNLFDAGTDISRQNLTSVDVRF